MVAVAEKNAETITPVNGRWPEDQYVTVRDVPVFAEHQTTTKNGRLLRFSRRELQAVADRCNQRIRETGDYAVICLQHTLSDEQRKAGVVLEPEVVGFAGPFRVDRLGEKYAILADFHYFRDPDVLEKVKKHPRRSPELWHTDGPYEEMYLDPIALLGAEAPRLDMGLFYTATAKNGQAVEKYSAAACPSSMNVFIPGGNNDSNKKQYDANLDSENSMLSPEDVKQIVDAISQADWAQWTISQMQAEQAANASVEPQDDTLTSSVDVPKPAGSLDSELPAGGPSEPEAALPPAGDGIAPKAGDFVDSEDDDDDAAVEKFRKWRRGKWGGKKKSYSAEEEGEDSNDKSTTSSAIPDENGDKSPSKYQKPQQPERYARLEKEITQLRGQITEHRRELESERATRIDAERYSKLSALRQHYVFDLDREFERVKYNKMSDQQFAEFAGKEGMIENNYQPIPVGEELPTFDRPAEPEKFKKGKGSKSDSGDKFEPERYSAEQREQALRYCEAQATAGKPVDYKDVLKRIGDGEQP